MSKRKLILANNPLLAGPALRERQENLGNTQPNYTTSTTFKELPIIQIDPDPDQPRSNFDENELNELSQSIKQYGVLSPILVRPSKIAGRYLVVAGERRLKAATKLGLETVPVIIDRSLEGDKEKTLAIQLVENLQRSDLSPLERAQAIGILRDKFSLSIRDIAERLGLSKSLVHRSLELLLLPPDLIVALQKGIPESKIMLLAKIDEEDVRAIYLKQIDELTRADIEQQIKISKQKSDKKFLVKEPILENIDPEDERIADEIQRSLGVKVRLVRDLKDETKGKLTLEFYSEDDLQEIFRKLVSEV